MDTTSLTIAIAGTLLFIGLLLYKALWFFRKINSAPDNPESKNGDEQQAESSPD
jgi:hypothetical protein